MHREPPRRPDPERPGAPTVHRSEEWKYALRGESRVHGLRVSPTHAPRPRGPRLNCHAIDQMQPERLADVPGTVATFTIDHLAFSLSPPVIGVIIDFDGGGRFRCELTDARPDELSIGDRVSMTFRRIWTAQGVPTNFWKARPLAGATGTGGAADRVGEQAAARRLGTMGSSSASATRWSSSSGWAAPASASGGTRGVDDLLTDVGRRGGGGSAGMSIHDGIDAFWLGTVTSGVCTGDAARRPVKLDQGPSRRSRTTAPRARRPFATPATPWPRAPTTSPWPSESRSSGTPATRDSRGSERSGDGTDPGLSSPAALLSFLGAAVRPQVRRRSASG